jgi:uncharacterized peroxidase-related enzyme
MSKDVSFASHTVDTAPEAAKGFLRNAKERFGFVPQPLARMAESPSIVEAFLSGNGVFEKTSLAPMEREVLIMRVATHHGCSYCVAMHTATLSRLEASKEVIEALRSRAPLADARLQAMATFVDALQEAHGAVNDAALSAFLDAGYSKMNALEAVLGVGIYTMSTYANRLTRAPLDDAFAQFGWNEPGTVTAE